ncbi:MAG: efflux RND transporter periplasmic adaptor subunit [Ignavibacteriaceae bacterium]|nr:efflux RND transporter periplasmic adaptor subunit [Ignavibacteriaceae bacterium]
MKIGIKILISLTALGFLFWGCGENGEPQKDEIHNEQSTVVTLSDESIKQIDLKTDTVKLSPFTGYLIIPATVISNQDGEAYVGSLVHGRVHSVMTKIGDYVSAGEILMYVEGLEIGELKSGYLKAKANYDFAKADYERHRVLLEQNIGSKQTFYIAEAEYQKAYAEFQAEDKRIHSVGLTDEDLINENDKEDHTSGTLPIKSPISGVVVERNVVIGQFVDGTTTAFKIINTNSVWVDGQIYEKDLLKIKKTPNVVFTSSTYGDEKFNGKIIYIGQTVDQKSRTITVRGEFNNSSQKLKQQMFGELKIPVGANEKAILINEEAVVTEPGGEYVFVETNINATGGGRTFEQRIIITGTTIGKMVEVKEGLKPGETIAVNGVFYLKSDLKKDELEGDEH